MAAEGGLRERIARAGGSLGVADLFTAGGPVDAYYARGAALGPAGDFVTAPEVSQMFGELVGLWLVDAWQRQGSPAPFTLADLGPGHGTLMRDLLRASRVAPAFRSGCRVHLVERSPALRDRQATLLAEAAPVHHADLASLPDGPLFVVANEFLDALPAHQLVRTVAGWCERCVVVERGALAWSTRPASAELVARAEAQAPGAPVGAIVEPAPVREALVAELGRRIARHGGAALLIDYGGDHPAPVDTLQAVRAHAPVDALAHLETADLTMAVAFAPLRRAAEAAGARAFGPLPQARVLRALGLELRAMRLAAGRSPETRREIFAAARRLTDPRAMGELFKMMGLVPDGVSPPAGFAGMETDA